MIITGKTRSGFKFAVDSEITKDLDFVLAISKTQKKDPAKQLTGAADLITAVLGDSGIEDLKAAHGGHISAEEAMEEIGDIIKAIGKSSETAKK